MKKLQLSLLIILIHSSSALFAQNELFSGGAGSGYAKGEVSTKTMSGQIFWVGGSASNPTSWNDPLNWFPNTAVPVSVDRISLDPNGTVNGIVLDQSRTVSAIDFNASGKKIDLGTYNLTVTGAITGANSTNYIRSASGGLLIRSIAANESFSFPLGNATYNPVTITNKTGTADQFSVRIADQLLSGGTSGNSLSVPRVNRTWHISKTNPTANAGSGVDFQFQWNATEESGGIASFKLNHHDGTGWNWASIAGGSESVSGTTTKTLSFTGYKGAFSPFAVGETAGPLPVTWLSFNGRLVQKTVLLEWKTAAEFQSSHFDVERSTNGLGFLSLGRVTAAGNSTLTRSYQFKDDQPLNGTSVYRLKQVDLSGHFSYSTLLTIKTDLAGDAHVAPNPVGASINLTIPTGWKEVYEWQLYDAKGLLIRKGDGLRAGVHQLPVFGIPAGMYQFSLHENGVLKQRQLLMKK